MNGAGTWTTGSAGTWVALLDMIDPQRGSIMPWSTDTVSELRTAFVHAVRTAGRSVTQAAKDFGISRKTADKWLALRPTTAATTQ
jgi:hypothetical protein